MGPWFMWSDYQGWVPVPPEYEAEVEWQQRPELHWEAFAAGASRGPSGGIIFDFARKD